MQSHFAMWAETYEQIARNAASVSRLDELIAEYRERVAIWRNEVRTSVEKIRDGETSRENLLLDIREYQQVQMALRIYRAEKARRLSLSVAAE